MKALWLGLVAVAGAGCDAGGESGDGAPAAPSAAFQLALARPGAERVESRWGLDRQALALDVGRPTLTRPGVAVHTPPVIAGDNATCESAARLDDRGLVGMTFGGGETPAGCFDHGFVGQLARYYAVTVGAHEVATVRLDQAGQADGWAWMEAAAGCGDLGAACGGGWASVTGGVAIQNDGDAPVDRIVAVMASEVVADRGYALTLERAPLAPNATCAGALPLDPSVEHTLAEGGLAPNNLGLTGTLYFTVAIPAHTRASASLDFGDGDLQALALYMGTGCLENESRFMPELANASDQPLLATVLVAQGCGSSDAPFRIDVDFAPLAAASSCESPAALAVGDTLSLDLEQGGNGPASCGCLLPTRAEFLTVTVPAGATVDVSATVAGDGSQGSASMVSLDSACTSECGFDFVFGSGGVATLTLTNDDASAPLEKTVLVVGQPGWVEGFTVAPVATLSAVVRE
ncbi:MAG: hypothetical protein U1F43_23415 [Myxococcota bacterium]